MQYLTRRHILTGSLAIAGVVGLPAVARGQTMLAVAGMYDAYVLATLRVGTVSTAMSEVAVGRAANPEVLRFAELELAEHRTVAAVLDATGVSRIASEGQSALQMTPQDVDRLSRLTETPRGEDFDLAYIEAQIAVHEDLRQVQEGLLGEIDPTVETVTARLLSHAAASDLVTLGFLQVLLTQRRILRLEGLEPSGTPRAEGEPEAPQP